MPSGETHAGITLATAGLTYMFAINSGEPPDYAVATALGCLSGILLTPDLDVKGIRADKIVRNELGLIPAFVWGLLWNPYSALIPHRSIISHGLILGTAIRLIYIGIPLALLGLLPRPGPILGRVILGLLLSDNLHVGADFIVTGIKDIVEGMKE